MNKQQGNTISLSEPMSPLSTPGTLNWLASLSDAHLIMIILWTGQTLKNVSYLIIQCGDTRNYVGHSNKIDRSANGRICVCGKSILRGEEYFFQGEDFLTLFRIVDEWWTVIIKSRLTFIQLYDCLKKCLQKAQLPISCAQVVRSHLSVLWRTMRHTQGKTRYSNKSIWEQCCARKAWAMCWDWFVTR